MLPLVFLLALVAFVHGSALTTAIAANERLCFYADVDKAGENLASTSRYSREGRSTIDFEIKDPNDKQLLDGSKERQGDYVLTANSIGEYAFCFTNDANALSALALEPKLVDFDIMVESEPRREPSTKPGQIQEHTSALEESVFRLNGQLLNVKRMQKL